MGAIHKVHKGFLFGGLSLTNPTQSQGLPVSLEQTVSSQRALAGADLQTASIRRLFRAVNI